jgi:hypothetical protein
MLAWLVLAFLVAAEAGGIGWRLRKEYYPVIFNGWAVLIYTGLFAADTVIAWVVSVLFAPGSSSGITLLMVVAIIATVIVALLTLFLRWVVRTDITDIPPEK